MICSHSTTNRLIPHLRLSTIRTPMSVKIKMTSASMPPALATPMHYLNSWHNTTQCNQSQYLTLTKQICAQNPSASEVSQTNQTNSLVSPFPPDPGEHGLKRSATATGEQDFLVKWFKLIHPSPTPRMAETPVNKPVHVVFTHCLHELSVDHQLIEEYIPPSLHTLCNLKPPMFHLFNDSPVTQNPTAP